MTYTHPLIYHSYILTIEVQIKRENMAQIIVLFYINTHQTEIIKFKFQQVENL